MDAPLNSPYTAPPAAYQRVRLLVDPEEGAPREVLAYRVDYRVRVAYPDFADPETGIAWRFSARITGQDHIPADAVRGWREMPRLIDLPDGYATQEATHG
jgi:hypothetical protein